MSRYDVDWDEMEDLRVVAPLFDELRAQFAEGPAPQIGTELATLFVFGAPPVGVVSAPKAPSRSRVAKRVAAGAIGGLALVGGMGAAGALPAPIQDPVAAVARAVGLNLPRPHHHRRHDQPAKTDTGRDPGSSSTSGSHAHRSTHVSTTGPAGERTSSTGGSTGADTQQSGTGTKKVGSGTPTTADSSVTSRSGSAVSSTSPDKSGGPNNSGGHHPTYHGNGRSTRGGSGSTSTTSPPTTNSTTPTTTPSTTPTTAAP